LDHARWLIDTIRPWPHFGRANGRIPHCSIYTIQGAPTTTKYAAAHKGFVNIKDLAPLEALSEFNDADPFETVGAEVPPAARLTLAEGFVVVVAGRFDGPESRIEVGAQVLSIEGADGAGEGSDEVLKAFVGVAEGVNVNTGSRIG
jgi:hypothetical protein